MSFQEMRKSTLLLSIVAVLGICAFIYGWLAIEGLFLTAGIGLACISLIIWTSLYLNDHRKMAKMAGKFLAQGLIVCIVICVLFYCVRALWVPIFYLGVGLSASCLVLLAILPFGLWALHKEKQAKVIINKHLDTLIRRWTETTIPDHYGVVDEKPWSSEKERFIEHFLSEFNKEQMMGLLDEMVTANSSDLSDEMPESTSPRQYEIYCAEMLKRAGWEAQVTQESNDQGVDVIAKKNGNTVVLQCKLYTGSVGNAAIQEVSAGLKHYRANAACVVSNAPFTKSAKALARPNLVLLLHHKDLHHLDEKLAS